MNKDCWKETEERNEIDVEIVSLSFSTDVTQKYFEGNYELNISSMCVELSNWQYIYDLFYCCFFAVTVAYVFIWCACLRTF